jgi:hypothetical protein
MGSGFIDPLSLDPGTGRKCCQLPPPQKKRPTGTHWIGWVGPISDLDDIEKRILDSAGLELRPPQSTYLTILSLSDAAVA